MDTACSVRLGEENQEDEQGDSELSQILEIMCLQTRLQLSESPSRPGSVSFEICHFEPIETPSTRRMRNDFKTRVHPGGYKIIQTFYGASRSVARQIAREGFDTPEVSIHTNPEIECIILLRGSSEGALLLCDALVPSKHRIWSVSKDMICPRMLVDVNFVVRN